MIENANNLLLQNIYMNKGLNKATNSGQYRLRFHPKYSRISKIISENIEINLLTAYLHVLELRMQSKR